MLVQLSDPGGASVTIVSSANISDAPLSATGIRLDAVEGASTGSVVLATFLDQGQDTASVEYTAQIWWGDLQLVPDAGTVSNGKVYGNHTYADEGTYSVRVKVIDDGGSNDTALTTISVADAALTSTGMSTVPTQQVGQTFSGALATFTDPGIYPVLPNSFNAAQVAASYTASVQWGDGSTSAGLFVSPLAPFRTTQTSLSGFPYTTNKIVVYGNHKYTAAGTDPITVTLYDDGKAQLSVSNTVQVVPSTLSFSPVLNPSSPTNVFNGSLGTVSDAGSNPNWTATISGAMAAAARSPAPAAARRCWRRTVTAPAPPALTG